MHKLTSPKYDTLVPTRPDSLLPSYYRKYRTKQVTAGAATSEQSHPAKAKGIAATLFQNSRLSIVRYIYRAHIKPPIIIFLLRYLTVG